MHVRQSLLSFCPPGAGAVFARRALGVGGAPRAARGVRARAMTAAGIIEDNILKECVWEVWEVREGGAMLPPWCALSATVWFLGTRGHAPSCLWTPCCGACSPFAATD